ncbi:3-hydroxyisobutyryl-CoA hydrolase [Crucibulum laeve]|uniref:3-hydroxyisobutyryl-CoA hydrolase n=1 Tax=Crucibulum laeve TaxID=68775 RepID=A0A5C3MCI0_9AGAR|nr:3-hydroxyisobutyryl-CoA hydrolase [Crucibulum laeve]
MLATTSTLFKSMSRSAVRSASHRTKAIGQHMMSTSAFNSPPDSESTVIFESIGALRRYTLNRPAKRNGLNEQMLSLLRPKIEEWSTSDLCGSIVGTGNGLAFCAGGDVPAVVADAKSDATRPRAIDYFKREFEMDYILAALNKPYVAVLDGITMGGGVGLVANAPFRIATERTDFAMPETKIGYCPDVGASYFLSRMDGELGTYLALTGESLKGRAVFEHGFATHYIPSRRVPMLLDRLAALEDSHPRKINQTIEELSSEREPTEPPAPFVGPKRTALDYAFRHNEVEKIILELEKLQTHEIESVGKWATDTLGILHLRSPTSLKVALKAIRKGKKMSLLEALEMELGIATAFCSRASPDFAVGVKTFFIEKSKQRPNWSPSTIDKVSEEIVDRFFNPTSKYLAAAPRLEIPKHLATGILANPNKYALPSEAEIGAVVRGEHPSGATGSIRLDELLARFAELYPGKLGVKERVLEVANRRCELVDNADGNVVWLKWKHEPSPP